MKKIGLAVMALGMLSVSALGQVVQDDRALFDKVERLEQDLVLLQRKVYKTDSNISSSGAAVTTAPQGSVEHLYAKVADVERIAMELTAQMEELAYQQNQLSEQLKRMNADVEVRFSELNKASQPAVVQVPAAIVPKQGVKASDPASQYDEAYNLLKQTDYEGAEKALKAFLEAYPTHELAGNAQYWLGETYYVRGLYDQAVVMFAEGFQKYKTSTKGPDNLLKLGMSMARLNKTKEACTAFKSLPKEFPKASQTLKVRAKNEAEKLSCPS